MGAEGARYGHEVTNRVPAITLSGLWKRFGTKIAVGGLDLTVPAGSFVGLVGQNGAGKTTVLSMATGLLRPDLGQVSVLGHDLWTDSASVRARAKALIGVLPDGVRLFELDLADSGGVARAGDLTPSGGDQAAEWRVTDNGRRARAPRPR